MAWTASARKLMDDVDKCEPFAGTHESIIRLVATLMLIASIVFRSRKSVP
jgi:hypothetical protein